MVDNNSMMESGRCSECGAKETDGFSCYELFCFPLAWEHNDPELYALHFWLVSCYMIQHPSNYTVEGHKHLVTLFTNAYDNDGDNDYILKKNRERVTHISKITNPLPNKERKRTLRLGRRKNAIENIIKWKEKIRDELN
ncbi:hypothetical protein SAMN04488072_103115 [Lentibacillus halodurans]|uniref:Uncharacterized protein n=1 Tax=Lentibacillus halodurans TaxID=237679 RepID=A0A1I0WKV4_9BACI|nr:DUF5946 family protein [Lentibacillus halodurans]SFA89379.1 hypothetical protein SAMN04488072_103115 [Lentibacillus halodurans]